MPSRLGPRFAIEALFLVAVAVAIGFADLSSLWIVVVMAAAWLLVAIVEWLASHADRPALVVRAPEARWPGADAPAPAVVEPHPAVAPEEAAGEDAEAAPAPAVAEAVVIVEEVAVVEEVEPVPEPAGWQEPAAAESAPLAEPAEEAAPPEEAAPVAAEPAASEPVAASAAEPEGPVEEAPVAAEPVEAPEEREDRPRPWWRRRAAEAAPAAEAEQAEPTADEQPAEADAVPLERQAEAAPAEHVAEIADEPAEPAAEPEAPRRRWPWRREPEPADAEPHAGEIPEAAPEIAEEPVAVAAPADEAPAEARSAEGAAEEPEPGATAAPDPWLDSEAGQAEAVATEEPQVTETEAEKPRRRRFFGRSRGEEAPQPAADGEQPAEVADVAASGAPEPSVEEREAAAAPPTPAPPEPPRRPATASRGGVFRRYPQPREWSLWELERAVREHGGSDAKRKREWNVTLMHLRQYANARGTLPVELDPLVRETFGDVIDARGR